MRDLRTVLLIAFHFPPIQGSSGWQRTLRFAEHLPTYGWRPIVLTINPRAYESRQSEPSSELPDCIEVHRVFGLDTARHLSVFGRYPESLALPDRWGTWRLGAVPKAMRIIRKRNVQAIWSTFPIATAHHIGLAVSRRSGLPWIAEFRDPMWQGNYPPGRVVNAAWQELERHVFDWAKAVVVTTPGAQATYENRFPSFNQSRIVTIANGYDERTFRRAEEYVGTSLNADSCSHRPLKLLHSGIVYRHQRDPSQLFAAVAALKERGDLTAADLCIVFRACGDEEGYRHDVAVLHIDDIVRIEPPIAYVDALREMLTADGLLILQSANCNAQVPAKLYEYLRADRPILALTDPGGDTARTLEAAQTGEIARLDVAADIELALTEFVRQVRAGTARRSPAHIVRNYSREAQAGQLASLFDTIVKFPC